MTATTAGDDTVRVDELRLLEAEAVHIIREVGPYEPPENPDLVLDTTGADIDDLAAQVIQLLNERR